MSSFFASLWNAEWITQPKTLTDSPTPQAVLLRLLWWHIVTYHYMHYDFSSTYFRFQFFPILGRKRRHQQHLSKSPRMDLRHWLTKLPMKLATVSMCLNTLISSTIKFSSFSLFHQILFLKQENLNGRFYSFICREDKYACLSEE